VSERCDAGDVGYVKTYDHRGMWGGVRDIGGFGGVIGMGAGERLAGVISVGSPRVSWSDCT